MNFFEKLWGSKPSVGIIGCGWLGLPLANKLSQNGFKVIGCTTNSSKRNILLENGVSSAIVGKLNPKWEGEDLGALMESDFLIIDFPPGQSPTEIFHQQQMEYLCDHVSSTTKVIYTSSTSVYPELGKEMSEEDVIELSHAAHTKVMLAELTLRSHLKQHLTVLRLGGLTGKDRILAKYFSGKKNLEGKDVPVNLLHQDDAIRAIIFVLENNIWNETLNVVAPKHPTKFDYYTSLCSQFGLELPEFSDIVEHVKFKIIKSDKIQKLGFDFNYPDPMFFKYS